MSEPRPKAVRLSDRPDHLYLLREFQELYRRSSAGGSTLIRSHQRAVREAIARLIAADPEIVERVAEDKPVTAHLRRALDRGREGTLSTLVRAVEAVMPGVSWLYGYEKVPRGLARKYAYAEFAGPHGPILSAEVILGVVLFAPKCTYPAHAHTGLTESYYILSGAVSENDAGVAGTGSLIFNPPEHLHRITVDDMEPALLTYAWHGPPDILAGQKMAFTKRRKETRR